MTVPPQMGSGSSGSGYGPFGRKGFRIGLAGALLVIVGGVAMMLFGDGDVRSVGTALVILIAVVLLTTGAGLLFERVTGRGPR